MPVPCGEKGQHKIDDKGHEQQDEVERYALGKSPLLVSLWPWSWRVAHRMLPPSIMATPTR